MLITFDTFNKSHAVCYSYISYYTAYMKIHYPMVFHKTMLNGNLGTFDEFYELALDEGLELLPPHVNYSRFTTEIVSDEKKQLRIGFNIVNGIGKPPANSIAQNAPYNNINEFFEKNDSKFTNKKTFDALTSCSAFKGMGVKVDTNYVDIEFIKELGFKVENDDTIILNNNQLKKWYELYLEMSKIKKIDEYAVPVTEIKNKYIEKFQMVIEKDNTVIIPKPILKLIDIDDNNPNISKSRKKSKGALKDMLDNEFKLADPFTRPFAEHLKEIAIIEENELESYIEEKVKNGFSLSPHPLQRYADKIQKVKEINDGMQMFIAGIIVKMEQCTTRNGKLFYKLYVQTPHETVTCTLWNNVYKRYKNIIKQYGLVKIKGTKGYGGLTVALMAEVKNN